MVHWDDFRFILALHRHGTMTAAAAALRTNVATVSRRIERAGETLGGPVFQKVGGVWTITALGSKFVTVAEDFEAELNREHNNRDAAQAYASTEITVSAPPAINTVILIPALGKLLREQASLVITIENKIQAEGLGDADVFLRWGPPTQGRLVARKVGRIEFAIYRPRGVDFRGWVTLEEAYDQAGPAQLGFATFKEAPRVRAQLHDHKLKIMKQAGLYAVIPVIAGESDPELERAPEFMTQISALDYWYGYHASRRHDLALQSVVGWIIEAFRVSSAAVPDIAEEIEIEADH